MAQDIQSLVRMAAKTSSFQQAVEAVEALSLDDQAELLNLLHKRLEQKRRTELLQKITEVRQEYAQGNVRYGSVSELLTELDN